MGRKIALVVGNNSYPEPYHELEKAVEDACKVGGFLEHQLGFSVTMLFNKTAATVTNTLLKLVNLLEDDSKFFFYFAGHGLVVGNAASQSLLCSDANALLLDAVQGAPGAIAPDVLSTISRKGRGDMFFCLDVCRTQTLRQKGGPEIQRGGAGLRSVVNHPVESTTGAAARLFGSRLTLSSCEDGHGANDDGKFASALVDEMKQLYDGGYELKLDQNLVDAIQKRLNLGQTPALSGTPFVLVPGKTRVEPVSDKPQKTPVQLATEAALNAGRYDEAERLADAALELDTAFGWAIWVRNEARRNRELDQILDEGRLCLDQGEAEAAFQKAELVLKERPNDSAALELKRFAEKELTAKAWAESSTRPAGKRKTVMIGDVEYGVVWIPKGEFNIGSLPPEQKTASEDAKKYGTKVTFAEESYHKAKLTRGFWLFETPVTQKLYEQVMQTNPSQFKGKDRPVEHVSYDDALCFCAELTKLLPEGVTANLPTETQWEYACRAGKTLAYWFGRSLKGDKANCKGSRPYGVETKGPDAEATTPVKMYPANPWGLYDMHGNVFEWVLDYYGAYPNGTAVDPKGASSGEHRVCRGGSWRSPARLCRSAYRGRQAQDKRNAEIGFRVLFVYD